MTFFRTSMSPRDDSDLAAAVEQAHAATTAIRRQYGLDRFQLGFILHTVHENKLWLGKAESFSSYLQELRVNASAARQYMAVAKKFVVDLNLPDSIIEALAMCNMSVLYAASKVINDGNLEEILCSLLSLHQRDALQGLREMAPEYDHDRDPPQVNRMVDQFFDLPDDLRIGFLSRIGRKQGPSAAITA
jgi:hypothetical protein